MSSLDRVTPVSARRALRRVVLLSAGSLLASAAFAQSALEGSVAAGSATIAANGANTLITQTTKKAVIDWRGFSVAAGSEVRFAQPGRDSVTLNRVGGGEASRIDGSLAANGQIWLLNPDGVLIGGAGRVNAAGFVATTRAISDADFMAGDYRFGGGGDGEVANAGEIHAGGGYAILASGRVANSGLIEADLGQVALASGRGFALDLAGDKLLSFAVTAPLEVAGSVANSGTLRADGGRVLLTARSAASVVDNVINTSGLVQARSAKLVDGEIVLDGGDGGTVKVAGTLDASGLGAGESGGKIAVLGDTIVAGGRLDARGDAGGGSVLVGGGWQGAAALPSAKSAVRVAVLADATLDASAVTSGSGGTVVAWSDTGNADSKTLAYGNFLATGPTGGRIETSGHYLDASSATGAAGRWLFDPYDILICTQLTGGCTVQGPGSFTSNNGVQEWSGTGAVTSSIIFAGTISNFLSNGTSVAISTSPGQGTGAGDLAVNGAISKSGGGDATLTLRSDRFMTISAPITATTGKLNLDFGAAHRITVTGGASTITTNGGNVLLTVDGMGQTAAGDKIDTQAAWSTGGGSFAANMINNDPAVSVALTTTNTIDTGGGAVTLTAGRAGQVSNGGNITSLGGNVVLSSAANSNDFLGTVGNNGTIDSRDANQTAGGSVTLTSGIRAQMVNSGFIRSATGSVTLGDTQNPDTIARNASVIQTTSGNVFLNTGGVGGGDIAVLAENTGSINTEGGAVSLSAGSGSIPVATPVLTNVRNAGTIDTTNGGSQGGAVTLSGQNLSTVQNASGGSITSGFGAIIIQGANDSRAVNSGSLTATSGLVRLQVANTTIGSGAPTQAKTLNTAAGSITTGSGNIELTSGDDQQGGGVVLNNSGSLSSTSGTVNLSAGAFSTFAQTGSIMTGAAGGIFANFLGNFDQGAPRGSATFGGTVSTSGGFVVISGSGNFGQHLLVNGTIDTGGNEFRVTEFSPISADHAVTFTGSLTTGNGALNVNAHTGVIGIGDGVATGVSVSAGTGDVDLKAQTAIAIQGVLAGANVSLAGDAITVTADAAQANRINATGSIALNGSSSQTSIVVASGPAGGTLHITPELLDRSRAPLIKIGTDETVGAIFGSTLSPATNAIGAFGNQTRVYRVSDSTSISFSGFTTVAAGDTFRAIGGTITIGSGSGFTIFGKAEFVTLGGTGNQDGFTEVNGSLIAQGAGQWSIYAATPDDINRTGTPDITTDTAIWGVTSAAAIAGGLSYTGNRYIFGTAPSLQLNAGSPSKTYGDTFDQSVVATSCVSNCTNRLASGLVDASAYSNIFGQDAFNGATKVTGAGIAATAAAGTYALSVNPAYLPTGYAFSLINGTLTVDPRQLTVGFVQGLSKVYDKSGAIALTSASFDVTNLVNGDTVSINQTSGTIGGSNAGTFGISAGLTAANYNFTSGSASNYLIDTNATGLATITPKALTISAVADSKVYDSLVASSATPSQTGLVNGDSVTATQVFNSANVGAGNFTRISGVTVTDGNNGNNYTVTSTGTAAAQILARQLFLRAAANSKTYDGSTASTASPTVDTTNATSGLVGNDSVTGRSQSFVSRNVLGQGGSTIQVTGFNVNDGNGGNNYNVQTFTAQGTITPRALSVSANGATKVYDGTTTSNATPSSSGLVAGDTVGATVSYASANAGNNITTTVGNVQVNDGNGGANYTVTPQNGTGSITPRQLTGQLVGALSKVYDGTPSASPTSRNVSLGNFVTGEGATVGGALTGVYTAGADAGANLAVVTFLSASNLTANTGTSLANYVLPGSIGGQIGAITPKPLTATLTGTASKVYDGTTLITLSSANFALSGFVSGQGASVAATAGTLASPIAGSGVVVTAALGSANLAAASGTRLSNYTVPATVSGAIGTVQQRAVAVTFGASPGKVYDGTTAAALTAGDFQLANIVAGDTVTLTGRIAGDYDSKDAGTGKTVTATGLALGGSAAGNYTVASSLSAPVGTISPKQLTATLTGSAAKVYDATARATLTNANVAFDGFVAGEGVAFTRLVASYAAPGVGTNLLVTLDADNSAFAGTGATNLKNYLGPASISGRIGTITPATLTYTANEVTRAIGASTPALSGSVSGFVGGETLTGATSGTLTFTTTAPADPTAGSRYAVNGGGLTAANYSFVQAAGNATALTFVASAAITPGGGTGGGAASLPDTTSAGSATPASVAVRAASVTSTVTVTAPPPPPPPPPPAQQQAANTGSDQQPQQQPPQQGAQQSGGGAAQTQAAQATGGGGTPPPPADAPPQQLASNGPPPVNAAPTPPPVAAMPPSPIPASAPPTPVDSADASDAVLAEATAGGETAPPPASGRAASSVVLAPGISVANNLPPRPADTPVDTAFSGMGNAALWQ